MAVPKWPTLTLRMTLLFNVSLTVPLQGTWVLGLFLTQELSSFLLRKTGKLVCVVAIQLGTEKLAVNS